MVEESVAEADLWQQLGSKDEYQDRWERVGDHTQEHTILGGWRTSFIQGLSDIVRLFSFSRDQNVQGSSPGEGKQLQGAS